MNSKLSITFSFELDETGVAQESEYADIIVRYMIKALTLDSKDARLRFPRLLQILDRYPETTPAFANKVWLEL